MFSNVLETKCLEHAVILAVYWRKELNKFAHPTTSGKKRRDPNSCQTNARQPSASCDAHFARRSDAEAQTANGCVRHKLSFGRVQLHGNSAPNEMCFRLAFSPVLCAMDLCRVLMHFYAIMPRGYRDCMFRSEWLKDAKFKSLVGSDWLLNMIGKAKVKALQLESESARLSQTHGVSDTDSDTDNDYAVRISELRFLSRWVETIYEVYLFGNVTITCDFFHDDRMELGSHVHDVAHVFVFKCYVRPYSIVIVM